jgi:hypothetical protein
VIADFVHGKVPVNAGVFEIQAAVVDEEVGIMSFEAIVQGQKRGAVQLEIAEKNR